MVTAGAVREFLASVAAASPAAPTDPALPAELRRRGALTGTPERPELTAIGRNVLRELSVRADRVDPLELDAVSEELGRITRELDSVAHTAEYFLAELGPLTPPEAVPYLRISAAGLANRRSSPGELAEAFRNTWGMFEVMAGDPRDRLLAAEMLVRSSVPTSRLYAAINQTYELLHQSGLERDPVATAAILHLFPEPSPVARLEGWKAWRSIVTASPIAALLASLPPAEASVRFAKLRQSLRDRGAAPADAELAAAFLLLDPEAREDHVAHAAILGGLLAGKLPTPFLAATLLATEHDLSAEELYDWVEKAAGIARGRRLAPTDPELYAIAVALVHDLPPNRFARAGVAPVASDEEDPETATVPSLVALHFGMFRPIVESRGGAHAPPARPAAR
jgi:hypothetical protein